MSVDDADAPRRCCLLGCTRKSQKGEKGSNSEEPGDPTKSMGMTGLRSRKGVFNGSITCVLGVIDQESKAASVIMVDTVTPPTSEELFAKIAAQTKCPTRRLFLHDGSEMKTVAELIELLTRIREGNGPKPAKTKKIAVDVEVISTDGSDFQYKYGDHTEYRFGDHILRPTYDWLFKGGSTPKEIQLQPPQPPPLFLTGNLKDILPDFFVKVFGICDKYGPMVKLRVFDSIIYVCQDADYVDIINQLPDKRIPSDVYGEKGVAVYGVFIADGQQWQFGRTCLQGCLTTETIDGFLPVYAEKALEFIEMSKVGAGAGPVDVFDWMQRLTMDVICRIGFGHEPRMLQRSANETDVIVKLFDDCLDIAFRAVYTAGMDVMGIGKRQFAGKMTELNEQLDRLIDAAEEAAMNADESEDAAKKPKIHTILDTLIGATCPVTGRRFERTEIRDQLVTLLVAGHKTSSMLLTWTLYHAASQPSVEEKMIAELKSVFGNDMERLPEAKELRKLKYMDLVIRETLRLNSPVQTTQRCLNQPLKCGKYTLLPGGASGRGRSYCAVHIMGISRSKRYWGEDALEFRPERFEPEKVKKFHPFQFITFGGGKRLCIGNLFAITQVKTVLSIVLRRYYLRLVADKPVRTDPMDIASPLPVERGGGVWLQFTKRGKWDDATPEAAPAATIATALPSVAEMATAFDAHGRELLVLWAGEFGTTKKLALGVLEAAQKMHFKATLKTCEEVSIEELSQTRTVVVLAATYNSHPPPNAAAFVKALQELSANPDAASRLTKLEYSVLACGNSNWVSSFGKIGKDIDDLLEKCGAQRMFPMEIADKNDEFDHQALTWRRELFVKLGLDVGLCVPSSETTSNAQAPLSFLTLEGDTNLEVTRLSAVVLDDPDISVETKENVVLPAYEDGESVEYYSAAQSLWMLATLRLADRQGTHVYNCEVDYESQLRADASLDVVRTPLKVGELVQVFSKHDGGTWLAGNIAGTQTLGKSTLRYTVTMDRIHNERTVDFAAEDVMRNVPADRIRRTFEVGDSVQIYRGSKRGWVAAVVEELPATSTKGAGSDEATGRSPDPLRCTDELESLRCEPLASGSFLSELQTASASREVSSGGCMPHLCCASPSATERVVGVSIEATVPRDHTVCEPWIWVQVKSSDDIDTQKQGKAELVLSSIVRRCQASSAPGKTQASLKRGFTGKLVAKQENYMEWAQQVGYHMGQIHSKKELCKQPIPEDDKYRSVNHLSISLPEGVSYKSGDHLEVVPVNPMEMVDRACLRLGVKRGAVVVPRSSRSTEESGMWEMTANGREVTVWAILGLCVDFAAVPTQESLAAFADVAQNESEKKEILELIDTDNRGPYTKWAKLQRSFVEALELWPSVQLTLARLMEIAPTIQPRLYSIASSPKVWAGNVELCCGVVKYELGGIVREGLCSNWLDRAPETACKVKKCPHMYLPEDESMPIMCVCGGTGIAPFLGFLQERAARREAGEQVGVITLYFGCRADYDLLCQDQLERWESAGVCRLSVSFSRKPGVPKEYVQHALQRDAAAVRELLAPEAKGRFYLCGSASTLAKDCIRTMAEILGMGDLEVGHSEMQKLQDSGRVSLDVWG